jgi:hypothetical protein
MANSSAPFLPPLPPSLPLPPYGPPHAAEGHCGGEQGTTKVVIGIIVHVCGSIGINTGQNYQAMALSKLDEQAKRTPWKSPMWSIGCAAFIICSIVNFVALTLAPASILVPLESVQFVNNVFFGKFVRKVRIPLAMWIGVTSMISGTVLAVAFGNSESYCFNIPLLVTYWSWNKGWAWWIYLVISFILSAIGLAVHSWYDRRKREGLPRPYEADLKPIAFAVPSALLGGAQMIIHSKVVSELAELLFQEGGSPLPPSAACGYRKARLRAAG